MFAIYVKCISNKKNQAIEEQTAKILDEGTASQNRAIKVTYGQVNDPFYTKSLCNRSHILYLVPSWSHMHPSLSENVFNSPVVFMIHF